LYKQHYNSKLAAELLEQMRIGTLHPDDVLQLAASADESDPYAKACYICAWCLLVVPNVYLTFAVVFIGP
jgi:hypothetical protein